MPRSLFVDQTGGIDTAQVFAEAIPLAKLIGLFVAIAFVPFVIVLLVGGPSPVGMLFIVVAQFVLAVGAGIVLMYVISRAMQLSDDT